MHQQQPNRFEDLIPHLALRVPRVDDLSAEQALRQATVDFMRETQLFLGTSYIYAQRGVSEYILEIPEDHIIFDIAHDGVTLRGKPVRFERDLNYDVIRLNNAREGDCYQVTYSYHISSEACEMPEEVKSKYLSAVINRAMMLLFTGDKDSIVSPTLYGIARQEYNEEVEQAKARRLHNFSNQDTRMRSPFSNNKRGFFP